MSVAYDTKRSKLLSNFPINEQTRAYASKQIKGTEKRSTRKDGTGKRPTRNEGIRRQTRNEGKGKIPIRVGGSENSPDSNEANEKHLTRNERSGIPRIRKEGTSKLPIRTATPPSREKGTDHIQPDCGLQFCEAVPAMTILNCDDVVMSDGYKPGKRSEDKQPEFCVEETKLYAPSCQGAVTVDMEPSNHNGDNEVQVNQGGTQKPCHAEYLSQPVKRKSDGKWDGSFASVSRASGGLCIEEVQKHSGFVTTKSEKDVVFHDKTVVLISVASVEQNFQIQQKERERLTGIQENESTPCDKAVVRNSGATTDQSLQSEESGTKHLTAKANKETIPDKLGAVSVIRALCEKEQKSKELVTPQSEKGVSLDDKADVPESVATVLVSDPKNTKHLTAMSERENILDKKTIMLICAAAGTQGIQNKQEKIDHLSTVTEKEVISRENTVVQSSGADGEPSFHNEPKSASHTAIASEETTCGDKLVVSVVNASAGQSLDEESTEFVISRLEKEVTFEDKVILITSVIDCCGHLTSVAREETSCGDELVVPVVSTSGRRALDEEQESTELITPRSEEEVTFKDKVIFPSNVTERKSHENEQENTKHLAAMSEEKGFLDTKAVVAKYKTFDDQSSGNNDDIGDELSVIDCGGFGRQSFENEQRSIKHLTDTAKNTAMTQSDDSIPEKAVEITTVVGSNDQMICICEEDLDCGGSDRQSFENKQKSIKHLTVVAEKNTTMTQNDKIMPENSVEITTAVESKDQVICKYEGESRTSPTQIVVETFQHPEVSRMNPPELQENVHQAKIPTSSTVSSFVSNQPWNDWTGLDQTIQSLIRWFQLLQESRRDPATVERSILGNPLMANTTMTKDSKVSSSDKEVLHVATTEIGVQTDHVSQDAFGSCDTVRLKVLDQKAKTDQEITENTLGATSITCDSKTKVKSSLAERLGACSLEITEDFSAGKDGHDNQQPQNDLLTQNYSDLDFAASQFDESNMTKTTGSTPDTFLLDVSVNPKKDEWNSALELQAESSNTVTVDAPKPKGLSVPDLLNILPGALGHLEIVPVDATFGRERVSKMRSQDVAECSQNFRNCVEMTADEVEEVLSLEWVFVDLPVCSRQERIQEEAVDLSTVQLASPNNKPGEQSSDDGIDSCEEADTLIEMEAALDQEELPKAEVVVGVEKVQCPPVATRRKQRRGEKYVNFGKRKGKHEEDCNIS